MKLSLKWITFVLVFGLASCVSLTVNVYFPTTEIKQAAEEIEGRVRSGQGAEGMKGTSFLFDRSHVPGITLHLTWGGREAYAAQEVNIDIKSPEITRIIESRTKRYKEQLAQEMDKGLLGEGMDGFLAIRQTEGLDLKILTALKKLIKEENADRELLYKEILTGNKLEPTKENFVRVGKLFAEAIRKKMKVGHWYQVKKDEWAQKQKEEK